MLMRIERFEKDGFEPSFSWFKMMSSGHDFGDGGEREADARASLGVLAVRNLAWQLRGRKFVWAPHRRFRMAHSQFRRLAWKRVSIISGYLERAWVAHQTSSVRMVAR